MGFFYAVMGITPELQFFHEKLSKFQPRFIAIMGS